MSGAPAPAAALGVRPAPSLGELPAGERRPRNGARAGRHRSSAKDETCPLSTGRRTRRVQLVQGEGGGGGGAGRHRSSAAARSASSSWRKATLSWCVSAASSRRSVLRSSTICRVLKPTCRRRQHRVQLRPASCAAQARGARGTWLRVGERGRGAPGARRGRAGSG